MIWSAASKLVSKLSGGEDKKAVKRDGFIKRTLGFANTGIPIGREDEPAVYARWKAQENNAFATGAVKPNDGDELTWREFLWQGPATIDECQWGNVRWRFYSNGLVCCDAQMSNTSGRADNGDVQGHRIEVREKNGLLLGVWVAAFYVRRSLPERGFAASFIDQHEPLNFHFSEIDDTQSGAWVSL